MKIGRSITRALNRALDPFGYAIARNSPELYLHQYESYEQYKSVQVFHNKRKLDRVWADEGTLRRVGERVVQEFGRGARVFGLCHGTRNGFEQNFLADTFGFDVIGTDISETAAQFQRSVQWDFHDVRNDWVGQCDFVYTNSLDQSWKPKDAVTTWLGQLREGGLLFIEHTKWHGPEGAGEMDPFGVKPEYMPYVLSEWFGHAISIEIIQGTKANSDLPVWLFVIKKYGSAHARV